MCSPGMSVRDRVLAELAGLGPGTADALALLGEIRDLARFIDRAQGELARLTGVLDAAGGAAEAGYSSTAAFLRHGCGRSPGRAGELVATGRALRRLEATGKALTAGEISFDSAHAICRAAGQLGDGAAAAAVEEQLLAFARPQPPPAAVQDPAGPDAAPAAAPGLDPAQLRRLGEELVYRADPGGVEERQQKRFERRHLSLGFTFDHSGAISGMCGDAVSLEIIRTAVDAFGPPGGTGDTRTAAQRRMDGLTAACQAALDAGTAGTRHGAAPHLSILVEESTLAARSGAAGFAGTSPASDSPGTSQMAAGLTGVPGVPGLLGPPPAQTGYGALLTARQVLALACRADLSIIRWRDGLPLDVGRRYRTETPALRRALEARDQGCRAPGCGIPAAWCTAHHLTPWSQGGTTSLDTTALFCFTHHHIFIHQLGWTITGNPNATLHFTHPNGYLTLDSPLPAQAKPRAP